MARLPNAVDFWRGFALITIFINHIPGNFYERFTHRNFAVSDSADLFVFLAGWALRLTVGRPEDPTPTGRLLSRLGARIIAIYAAQILITSIALAMLAASARILDIPLLLEWFNAAAVFYDPVDAHIGLVLLTHQLGYFDILPLYVVLMLMAPAIALIHRTIPNWLLPISLAIYLVALTFAIAPPSWPAPGQWFFNPLAWQLVFVLGFLMARERGVGGFVRNHLFWFRLAAIPVLLIGAVMVQMNWWPDPTKVPEPKLLFLASKSYVTPIRLIQFLALVVLASALWPYVSAALPRLSAFLSMLGRNSLNVFCVASVLSLLCQIIRFAFASSILLDTLILVGGITALGLTAWLSEWQDKTKKPK